MTCRSRGMAPYNFDLFTTWRYMIRCIPWPYHFEENDPLFAHKLILSQIPSACHNEGKLSYNSGADQWSYNLQSVTMPTELSRLQTD